MPLSPMSDTQLDSVGEIMDYYKHNAHCPDCHEWLWNDETNDFDVECSACGYPQPCYVVEESK